MITFGVMCIHAFVKINFIYIYEVEYVVKSNIKICCITLIYSVVMK